jgi:DNA-binding beta-propeller fold protein YncE
MESCILIHAETSLSHVISSNGRRPVRGVTVCDEKLFVLRKENKGRIERYDVRTFKELTSISVDGLHRGLSLTSCDVNHCLYVTGSSDDVYRVDVSTNNVILKWRVGGGAYGLSVNRTNNVLVSCLDQNAIKEYLPRGKPVRTIQLQMNHVTRPLHTVQLTEDRYVVCHSGPQEGVSVIDQYGALIATYRNRETTELLDHPRCIVAKNNFILVADYGNNRVLLLNTSLSRDARDLHLPEKSQLRQPFCMYLDQTRDRLYVGECDGENRVLVFDNILSVEHLVNDLISL